MNTNRFLHQILLLLIMVSVSSAITVVDTTFIASDTSTAGFDENDNPFGVKVVVFLPEYSHDRDSVEQSRSLSAKADFILTGIRDTNWQKQLDTVYGDLLLATLEVGENPNRLAQIKIDSKEYKQAEKKLIDSMQSSFDRKLFSGQRKAQLLPLVGVAYGKTLVDWYTPERNFNPEALRATVDSLLRLPRLGNAVRVRTIATLDSLAEISKNEKKSVVLALVKSNNQSMEKMGPMFNQLALEMKDSVIFARLFTDSDPYVFGKLHSLANGIRRGLSDDDYPLVLFMKNGEFVTSLYEYTNINSFRTEIETMKKEEFNQSEFANENSWTRESPAMVISRLYSGDTLADTVHPSLPVVASRDSFTIELEQLSEACAYTNNRWQIWNDKSILPTKVCVSADLNNKRLTIGAITRPIQILCYDISLGEEPMYTLLAPATDTLPPMIVSINFETQQVVFEYCAGAKREHFRFVK